MSATLSEATGRPYGIQRVCQIALALVYARQTREQQRHKGEEPARRGPTDATLLEAIQADLDRSPFQGEGHSTRGSDLGRDPGRADAGVRVMRAHRLPPRTAAARAPRGCMPGRSSRRRRT